MGEIKDKGAEVYRDSIVAGVPASGPNDPAKSDIRALFAFVDVAVGAAQAGIQIVSTTADRDTYYATEANRGKLVYVNNNNGSATDPANGVYEYAAGAPRLAQSFYEGLATVVQPLVEGAEQARDEAQSAAADINGVKYAIGSDKVQTIGRATGQLTGGSQAGQTTWTIRVPAKAGKIHKARLWSEFAGAFSFAPYAYTNGNLVLTGAVTNLTANGNGTNEFTTFAPVDIAGADLIVFYAQNGVFFTNAAGEQTYFKAGAHVGDATIPAPSAQEGIVTLQVGFDIEYFDTDVAKAEIISQADFDALAVKDAATFYAIPKAEE